MSQIGYVGGVRLHIRDYDETLHGNKVYCVDGHLMVPKRGQIKIHHFAHRAGEGAACQIEQDGKTDWHLWWQQRLRPDRIEFQIRKEDNLLKIADSINVMSDGTFSIVELQHSVMGEKETIFREKFYTRRDLLTAWGVPDCKATLTWIYDLTYCDIEIEHTYGDLVCFRWRHGTKYMLKAKCRTFYDFGKKDLIQVLHIHRPEVAATLFIGRLVPLAVVDQYLFEGVLDLQRPDVMLIDPLRQNTLRLADYQPSGVPIDDPRLNPVIEKLKALYFHAKKNKTKQTQLATEITECLKNL
jgi:hypothetical protein